MDSLLQLYLSNNGLTDAHLEKLARLPKLSTFRFGGPNEKIGPTGLKAIARLPKLNALVLGSSPLTPQDLAIFESLPLESLELRTTSTVDDSFVPALGRFKSLRQLFVTGDKLTPAGLEQLNKALPKCRIESDHGTWEPSASALTEREVAEWVINKGHSVRSHQHGFLTKLPLPTGELDITEITLEGNISITDDDLRRLAG